MAMHTKKYLYVIILFILVFLCIAYIIFLPIHYDNEIEALYFKKKATFNQVINLYKSHYPIYIYFHDDKAIDVRIRKPGSEFDTYIDLYDVDINDIRVLGALRKVNLNDSYINELYIMLHNINCVSIGLSSEVSKKGGGAIEIGLYRNFIYGFWKYLFFNNKIDNLYLRKYTTLSDKFKIIDERVGWDIFH